MMSARLLRVITLLALVLITTGCERRRMHHDQQIGLLDACEQARRDCLAAPEAKREEAISRWFYAVSAAKGLCANDLHDALVMKDEQHHLLALAVMQRLDWREHAISFLSDLESERLLPEQRERAAATLKALTGQDFGKDRAAWEAWLRTP